MDKKKNPLDENKTNIYRVLMEMTWFDQIKSMCSTFASVSAARGSVYVCKAVKEVMHGLLNLTGQPQAQTTFNDRYEIRRL